MNRKTSESSTGTPKLVLKSQNLSKSSKSLKEFKISQKSSKSQRVQRVCWFLGQSLRPGHPRAWAERSCSSGAEVDLQLARVQRSRWATVNGRNLETGKQMQLRNKQTNKQTRKKGGGNKKPRYRHKQTHVHVCIGILELVKASNARTN